MSILEVSCNITYIHWFF